MMLWGILLVGTLLVLVVAFQNNYANRVLPGVSAFNVDLGGMTHDQAVQALSSQFTFDTQAIFTFKDGPKYWQMNAADLGVKFDIEATVNAAMSAGRDSNLVGNLIDQSVTWLNGAAVAPIVIYDQNIAMTKLAEIAAAINQPAVDGSLTVNGLQITANPGQTGRTLDVEATLAELNRMLLDLKSGAEINLVIRETPPTVRDVELAAVRAQTALSAPLTLVTDDQKGGFLGPWTISVDQISSLMHVTLIDNGDGTKHYEVNIALEPFRAYLESLAPGLVTQPQDARFHFNEATRQLDIIKSSIGGRSMNIDQTLQAMQDKVFSTTDRTAQIAYDYLQPRYHNNVTAQELGITEMVIEATTYYAGSPANRRTNIAVGASLYDGIIIGPGEEFSFNSWLGDLSAEAGFTEGNVIFGGRTIPGIGGGICQVSTTAFRAAFWGGYTIIERNAHGYRVGYYEQNNTTPGLDAAIWTPERDFRFQNDTPYSLLIETEVFPETSTLQFRFYSTKTGRQVEIQPAIVKNVEAAKPTQYEVNSDLKPGDIVQVDYAAQGADVTVYRVIRDAAGNEIKEDSIYTHYLSWGAIYQVAPGDSRLSS
jgi:vancomycin resistance protein YoaR